MKLVENVKLLCVKNNTSIPKVEKTLGLSNGSIYNWDRSFPSIDKVIKVADYFNVSVDGLIGREQIELSQFESNKYIAARSMSDENVEFLKKLAEHLSIMGRKELEREE